VTWRVAEKNISANRELETLRTRQELVRRAAQTQIEAYSKLAQSLNTLQIRLKALSTMIEVAGRGPMSPRTTARVSQEVYATALAERDVISARNNPIIQRASVAAEIDDSVRRLAPVLESAGKDPMGALTQVDASTEEIVGLVTKIESLITDLTNSD